MEKGFFHPTLGYWQTMSAPSEEVVASYPTETVEVPLKPGADYRWDGSGWVYEPAPTPASDNKAEAESRLAETDWVNQPDVYDPANTPHLINRQAFVNYRVAVRGVAVNPTAGTIAWPTAPSAVWG